MMPKKFSHASWGFLSASHVASEKSVTSATVPLFAYVSSLASSSLHGAEVWAVWGALTSARIIAQHSARLFSLHWDRYSSKVSPPSPHLYVSGIAPYSDAPTALGSSVFGEHYSLVARPNAPRLRPLQQLLPNSAAAPWLHPLQQLLPVCIHFSCRMKWFPIWLHFWSHTCTCKV